jgi:hypothetical protein
LPQHYLAAHILSIVMDPAKALHDMLWQARRIAIK